MTLELTDPANIGGRIKWLRESKKMSQQKLAETVGIKQSTISDIENLRSNSPNAANLMKIAAALEANPSYITTGQGDPWEYDPPPKEGTGELATIYAQFSPSKRAALLAAARALATD